MSLHDEIAAAEAVVSADRQKLKADESALAALVAQSVPVGFDCNGGSGNVEWGQTGAGFAFCRVADGNIYDASFSQARIESARAAGVPVGPYYFCRVAAPANFQRNGREEAGMAVYFARNAGWGAKGDLPLVLDFEEASINGQAPAKCAHHVYQFASAYRYIEGHWPILYTNPNTWRQVVGSFAAEELAAVGNCPLWVADWGVSSPAALAPWGGAWSFWQYRSESAFPGVAGKVDLDAFSGTRAELEGLAIA